MIAVEKSPKVGLKSIALPAEHGGWGFLLEPLLLGLLAAPSLSGVFLGIAAFGVFLLHQPLKIALKDRLRGRRYARTAYAERFVVGYGVLALIGLILASTTASASFTLPLILAAPLALIQLGFETRNEGRSFLPEIAGALALGALAPMMALASGWPTGLALMLWLLVAVRIVPSILYVRTRISRIHGKAAPSVPPLAAQMIGLMVITVLLVTGLIQWPALIAGLLLLGRTLAGLRPNLAPVRARTIGFQELGLGIVYAILVALAV